MAKGKKAITAGYFYYMSLDVALCHSGVDEIKQIKFADRVAWSGSVQNGAITIDNKGLFGGENREGGVSGTVEVLSGSAAQSANGYLQAQLGDNIPAFRGVCRLLFERFYIGLNPYLKNLAIQARRTDTRADGSAMWYSAKARIGDDMNPAHAIYELYTDKHWGLGLDAAYIDAASFTAAADKLYTEAHGISFLWDGTKSVEDILTFVLGQINAIARQNIGTGKIELKLIRDDYSVGNIPAVPA